MKKIEFKKVGMKNFCNYIDPMELEFENGKLVTITGPNGVGKSNIFNALPYTLFGITGDGMKGDDVVNNEINKDCHTWTEFSIDDDDYRVDRFHKFTRKGNSVELSKNNEKPYKVGQRETLPEIEKLLLPRKLFMNTLLFSQGIKDFFTDLTDTEKKDIFRKILQLDNYVIWHDQVKRKIKDIGERILKLNQTLDLKNEMTIDVLKQIDILKKAEEEFNKNRDNVIKSIKDEILNLTDQRDKLIQEFDSYKEFPEKIKEVNDKIINQTQKISELALKLENAKETINNKMLLKKAELMKIASDKESDIKTNFSKQKNELRTEYDTKVQETTNKFNDIINDLNLTTNTLNSERLSLIQLILEIKENVIDRDISVCPTCYQEIGEKEKDDLHIKVTQYRKSAELKKIEQAKIKEKIKSVGEKSKHDVMVLTDLKIRNLDDISEKEGQEILKIQTRFEEVYVELITQTEKLIAKTIEVGVIKKENLESELEELKTENKELQVIDEKIRGLGVAIPTITTKLDMVEKSLKQKELEKFNDEVLILYITKLTGLKDEIKNIKSIRIDIAKDLEILEFWKIGYSQNGIPAMLIDESIPFLNDRVAYYLDKIASGRFTVSFDTMSTTKSGEFRDKISVNVLDNQTKANSRVQLSGGQTRMIDIATILTLNDLQSDAQDVSINILLFDEIFDSLDDSNIGYVSNVIRSLTKDRFVSIISHRHIDQIEADESLNLH
jgi:DNA repair exonuclease SbcCD ATPase subunit